MADLLVDEPRRGWLLRTLGGRSAVAAFVAGAVGAVAFVASLIIDWQRVILPRQEFEGASSDNEFAVGLDAAGYGTAYVIGVLGLLALLGGVLARPELAARLRLSAAGLGVGIAGVLVGIMNQLQNVMTHIYGIGLRFPPDIPENYQEVIDATTFAAQPGQFLAFGAVVALVAGVWLAAGPARGGRAAGLSAAEHGMVGAPTSGSGAPVVSGPATVVSGAPVSAEAVPSGDAATSEPAAAPVSPPLGPPGLPPDRAGWPQARVGYADGLSVTSSDVIDPGSQADILRN
jgi:hypothetical protein